ncbi:MAG: bacteriohemerythrin [Desulfobulbaceae bacterium]|nr:bacteriohemerythrin [Desulfobulbaceae bacterium]HIJ79835.1 hemerythrin family protein [Deltaproteobacteria bacterium]
MGLINWHERYSVNIAEIDEQHKQLIKMINELHDAMMAKKGKDALLPILNQLASYCIKHFSIEEKMMQQHDYPDFADHQAKHQKMTAKVKALINDVQTGKSSVTIDVMNFLKSWLDKHIMGTDQQYAPFLNSKGVS